MKPASGSQAIESLEIAKAAATNQTAKAMGEAMESIHETTREINGLSTEECVITLRKVAGMMESRALDGAAQFDDDDLDTMRWSGALLLSAIGALDANIPADMQRAMQALQAHFWPRDFFPPKPEQPLASSSAPEHESANLQWFADLICEAADAIRGGGKLGRQDYFSISKAALRMIGSEAGK